MDEFSGLGIVSAFCPTFLFTSLMRSHTLRLLAVPMGCIKLLLYIASTVVKNQVKHEIFPARATNIVNG